MSLDRQRMDKAFELLKEALRPYIEQELRAVAGERWIDLVPKSDYSAAPTLNDPDTLLNAITHNWRQVFHDYSKPPVKLPKEVKGYVEELRGWRTYHAHHDELSPEDVIRQLDTAARLLNSIGASTQRDQVDKLKLGAEKERRLALAEQRKKAETQALIALADNKAPAWREVVTPHKDVRKGTFEQAEFAADLWQVLQGKGEKEYTDPVAFFHRTHLYQGLRDLLLNAIKRVSGQGGSPVVQLQITFGGGKTHSQIALFHLFGGQLPLSQVPEIATLASEVGLKALPALPRAVLVGTSLTPGSPLTKDDGTVVRTLWGEIAYQLGGREGYEMLRQVDENGTNPGALLDELLAKVGPCVILIDEWVAYWRQMYKRDKPLPAGDWATQCTFAQSLCESAKRAKNVLLCVTIPASVDENGKLVAVSQLGGEGGEAAYRALQDAVGRLDTVWRPATTQETYRIVSNRLFEPIPEDKIGELDAAVGAFAGLYTSNRAQLPAGCAEKAYFTRMREAYPIHPELYERLYEDWSTLEDFQRTRGVLRLMANVIHTLWEAGDKSAMILPASVPIAAPLVTPELNRVLPDNWSAVIEQDVDGGASAAVSLDNSDARLGKWSAARRVARTVFLGSAPKKGAASPGIDESRIKLGCLLPGENLATYHDALEKLQRERTSFMYKSDARYWFDTQPNSARLARERAEQQRTEDVNDLIKERLRFFTGTGKRGQWEHIHVAPPSSDVPDDRNLRLVVLGPDYPFRKSEKESDGLKEAKEIFTYRGSATRLNRNRVLFLAADENKLSDLQRAAALTLAWKSIVNGASELNLDPANQSQAKRALADAEKTLDSKINDTYHIALAPQQLSSGQDLKWADLNVSTDPNEHLAVRVMRKFNGSHVLQEFGGPNLIHELDSVPLWQGDQVSIAQLQEFFARYSYLPRLLNDKTLLSAIRDAVNRVDGVAYADSYDPQSGVYKGLTTGVLFDEHRHLNGWLVKLAVAMPLIDKEKAQFIAADDGTISHPTVSGGLFSPSPSPSRGATTTALAKTHFHAMIDLDAATLASRIGDISREVVRNLAQQVGTRVEIRLEISAENEDGFKEDAMRVVSENCSALKFKSHDFEEE